MSQPGELGEPDRSGRVPPVDELRPIVHGAKSDDRRWTYRVFRSVSIYLTWALLHTRVTPNQVTVTSLIVALGGLVLVAAAGSAAIAGCALLLAYHLLDRVDGELARYQQRFSLLGVYLDNAGHYLTAGGLLIAVAYGLAPESSRPQALWLVSALATLAAVMSRVEKHAAFHLFSQYVLDRPDLVDTVRHDAGLLNRQAVQRDRSHVQGDRPPRAIMSLVRDALLILTWFPVSTVILMVGFIGMVAIESTSPAIVGLIAVALLQILGYLGVEIANVSGNLGSEVRRLAAESRRFDPDNER